MDSYFSRHRDVELSTIYYVDTEIAANWTAITVVKSWPNFNKVTLPVICVRLLNVDSERKEVGSRTLKEEYLITVDIFAKSDGQRLDLATFLTDTLSDNWTHYNHSQTSGTPETLTRTANGKVLWRSFSENSKIDFSETVEVYDRFRHSITLTVAVETTL